MTRYLRERTLFGPLIPTPASPQLGFVVVIPAKDEANLELALQSLRECDSPKADVEVIVVMNTSEADDATVVAENKAIYDQARTWADRSSTASRRFHLLHFPQLPKKHAGVGLARKIGLDEGCRRLVEAENPTGILACFDADSRCDSNYLTALESHFEADPTSQACSIYFEHPTEGREFDADVYEAIIAYELHLRYFIRAQRYAGFPHAVQTIGSSMAVRCDAYQAQNGMNRRKAGEDFYFLHKFTPLGHVTELKTTRVIPSPRPSHRVPFGTGKAIGELLETGEALRTYDPRSFQDLRTLFRSVDELYGLQEPDFVPLVAKLPESVRSFLATLPAWERMREIQSNVTTPEGFRIRFFRWFDAFLIMKFLHHSRDHFYPDCEIGPAATWLLEQENLRPAPDQSLRELLNRFREADRAA